MAALTRERIGNLLAPYAAAEILTDVLLDQISRYLDLILLWNARTNLTAVRDPEELVQRQIGESLFAAQFMPAEAKTLMDFGSGGGFPGIPLQIALPNLKVTLAESQGKKASFLREAVRTLALPAEVWAKRVEEMPDTRRFDVVAMRAVDKSGDMTPVALERVADDGVLLRYTGMDSLEVEGWRVESETPVPLSLGRLQLLKRQ